MSTKLGMPSVRGMKDSFFDYGLGAAGGLVYAISTALTGSGLVGGLLGAVAAGSTIKGERGTVISTMLGFQTILTSMTQSNAQSSDPGVM